MKKYVFCLLFGFISLSSFSQIVIKVLDNDTKQPIEGAEIFYQKDKIATTDIKGIANINEAFPKVTIAAIEYETKEILVGKANTVIYMQKRDEVLAAVIIKADDSKARNLIKEVIKMQKENHPNKLESYKFYGYNKFLADTNPDSIKLVFNPKTKEDSTHNKEKKLYDKSMLFLGERVTEYKYLQSQGEKRTMIANRVSGIKTPLYEFAALQPVSMYLNQDYFNFMFMRYPNPISSEGLETYRYVIRDTIEYNDKPTIEVSYYSKKSAKLKKPLEGYLYIDKESRAVTKFFGQRIDKEANMYLEMHWEEQAKAWFPTSQFFKAEIFQGMEKLPQRDSLNSKDKNPKPKKDSTNYTSTFIVYDTKFHKLQTPINIDKKEFKGYDNEIATTAYDKAEEILNEYRPEKLTQREQNTYIAIDSVGKAEKIDKNITLLRLFTRGTLEWKKINLKPLDLFQFNDYEGFRVQLSAETNYKFNESFGINGYLAYGFRDAAFKGKIGIDYFINKPYSGKLFANYVNDVLPAGRTPNIYANNIQNQMGSLNNLYNSYYYGFNKGEIGYQQDIFKMITSTFSAEYSQEQLKFPYAFSTYLPNEKYTAFNTWMRLKIAPNAKYMRTPLGKVTVEDKQPYFYIDFMKSWKVSFTDLDFQRLEAKAFYGFRTKLGFSNLTAKGGIVFGDAPINYNFEGFGSAKNGDDIWKRFSVSSFGAFETMQAGSFFSDKYTSFSLYHYFPSFKLGKKNIQFLFIYKGLYGDMTNNTTLHSMHNFQIPNRYYQETGIELNRLLFNGMIGVGAYYRIGAYNTNDFNKDFFFKATISFPVF